MTEHSQLLQVEAAHPCFAGHFPGNPLLPGALLLQRLQHLLEAAMPGRRLKEVNSAKFLAPVTPGCALTVNWQCAEDSGQPSIKVRLQALLGERQACVATLSMARSQDAA